MFKRILFPTDFSLHADKIVECIPDLISLGMKETILVHVINPMKAAHWMSIDGTIIDKARQEADRISAAGNENVRQEMEKAQVQIRDTASRMAVDLGRQSEGWLKSTRQP